MYQIYVKESRSEVLVCIDRHMPDRLTALKEAARILQVEVMREQSNPDRNANWKSNDNIL